MSSHEDLIFIKGKNSGTFENETDKIALIEPSDERYSVIYKGTSSKPYWFSRDRIAICHHSKKLVTDGYVFINTGTNPPNPLDNVCEVILFSSNNVACENRYRLTFQGGKSKLCPESEIAIQRNASSNDVFRYLQAVCQEIKPQNKKEDTKEYLPKQFNRLSLQSLDDTAAVCLINPEKATLFHRDSTGTIIYPFGSNLSQMQAVENALTNKLSLIEGPPGTGKTQTILNVIANLVIRGKNVLIASPNNPATKNVAEKLAANEYGFLVAELGRRKNRDVFVAEQPVYPLELPEWHRSQQRQEELARFVSENSSTLRDFYKRRQKVAQLKTELDAWRLEYHHFLHGYRDVKTLVCRPWITVDNLRALRDLVSDCAEKDKGLGIIKKLQGFIMWGIGHWEDYHNSPIDFEIMMNRAIFERKIEQFETDIAAGESFLESHDADRLISETTLKSTELFRAKLYTKYSNGVSDGSRRTFDNPWEEPRAFRDEYPIITSTTNAAQNQIGKNGDLFDYIIIDESSQADLITGFLALSSAKNAVIVGDTKQLPCVITEEERVKSEPLLCGSDIPSRYSYTKQSLLSSLELCIMETNLDAPIQLLKEHYRCHPEIIGFCNEQFYNNELVVMSDSKNIEAKEALMVVLPADQHYDRSGGYNRVQAEVFKRSVLPCFETYDELADIGIATPYRKQVDCMRRDISFTGIEIDTVHKYQGREKSSVAFITRSNEINDFLDNPNLVNVAVSRARNRLALICSPAVVQGTNNIADLARYIEYHDGKIIDSGIGSAFDLIYPNMRLERMEYLARRGARSDDEYSEVRVDEFIQNALHRLSCENQIGYLRNYPLKQFLIDLTVFSEEERNFINTSAHADFLFYRKIDKSIVFELEVNGSQHYLPTQKQRDRTKQSILRKVGVEQGIVETNEGELEAPQRILTIISSIKDKCEGGACRTMVTVATKDSDHPWDRFES